MGKVFYRRRLPHWHPPGKALFLTWRLHGSLPAGRAFQRGEEFKAFDRLLDGMSSGPLYLRMPEIAGIVAGEILRLEGIQVSAWVILPNHVHLLAEAVTEADADWARHLKMIKGRSARQANLVLGRTGQPFWQEESFDRWVRDQDEFAKVRRYIERNPVTAGLADSPEEFRWSSAWREPE
ncbi:MAG: transposase [Bryobacteraceae bacterium]|nr:transposase [Bryobacteraceae bacterium]